MDRIREITPADISAASAARSQWNRIAKPLGSFGLLEEMVVKIAAVQGTADVRIDRRTAVVMCADNGVVAEGISQSDQSVTALSTAAIAAGRSNINALADAYHVDVLAVDLGVARDFAPGTRIGRKTAACLRRAPAADSMAASSPAVRTDPASAEYPAQIPPSGAGAVLDRKIARGTGNIAEECAMTRAQARQAITVGMDIVRDLKETGTDIIVTGEMGIGNTTIASALAAAYLDLPAEEVTGRGAGLSTEALGHKIDVIRRALALHRPDPADPIDVLSKVGGYDVAGMTGLFLGGAVYGIPVIIDGVISAAAAYTAYLLSASCADYMLSGHVSAEPASHLYLERLGQRAVISGQLRLGEGTGGILLLPLLDGALALYRNSHTFAGLGIDAYEELN